MKDYLSEVNARLPIRRSKREKAAFIDYVCGEIGESRVKCEIIDKKHRNVIIGSISEAEVVFTAHYDTPPVSVVPNLMMPANKILNIVSNLAYPLFLAIVSMVLAIVIAASISANEFVLVLIYFILYFGSFYLSTRCFTNKNNLNDNTSGVATILSLAANTDNGKVAFILFDNEEKGLEGSKAFNKKHKDIMNNKLVINFDCVGNGDQIIISAKDAATKLAHFESLKTAILSNDAYTVHYINNKDNLGNSDHKSFPCGVCVVACSKGKRAQFYTGRIHTPRDVIADSNNISFIAEKMSNFIAMI